MEKLTKLTDSQLIILKPIQKIGTLQPSSLIKSLDNYKPIHEIEPGLRGDIIGSIFSQSANLSGLIGEISLVNKRDIMNMLLLRFKNISAEEIYYAFMMDRYGEFGDPVKHYQIYGSEYVGQVLNRWKAFKKKYRADKELPLSLKSGKDMISKEEREKKDQLNKDPKALINCMTEYLMTGNIPIGSMYLYYFLYANKLLPQHHKKFRRRIRNKTIRRISHMDPISADINLNKYQRKFRESLRQILKDDGKISRECKKTIMIEFFEYIKNSGKNINELLTNKTEL
jgi:hypothetical protein